MTEEKIRKEVMTEFAESLKALEDADTIENALMLLGAAIELNKMMRNFGWISGAEFARNLAKISSVNRWVSVGGVSE